MYAIRSYYEIRWPDHLRILHRDDGTATAIRAGADAGNQGQEPGVSSRTPFQA